MAIEVSDIFGFGKGIEKLLDIVSKAVGRATKSYYARKDIAIRLHEIEELSVAIKQLQAGTGGIQIEGEKVSIQSAEGLPSYKEFAENNLNKELVHRTADRLTLQSLKRQLNIERVIWHTATQFLQEDGQVSEEAVSDDWITQFFKIVEEISSEEMQLLWSKILAGEIKRPGSFSLRTLEMIRNLSQNDAHVIEGIAKYAIEFDNKCILFKGDRDGSLLEREGVYYEVIDFLTEINFLQSEVRNLFNEVKHQNTKFTTYVGNKAIRFQPYQGYPRKNLKRYTLTTPGSEIVKILRYDVPQAYFDGIIESLLTVVHTIEIADCTTDIFDRQITSRFVHYSSNPPSYIG